VNIEEYISSGILDAYALGELTDSERATVEMNLARYPELRAELRLVEEAQEKLLMQTGIRPRAEVKKKLFEVIDEHTPRGKVVSLNFWKLAVAASVTLALITSYLAFNYRTKWKQREAELITLNQQNELRAQDYNQVQQRLHKIESDFRIMGHPDFRRVIMVETPNARGSMASVYWNEKSNEVYLGIQSLRELARENQYQLWAIIDGKPVDAGVFDTNVAGLIKMKDIPSGATTFAVTVEPRGGKSSPTLETMQVAGNVVKG
jgi:anti-sigma-K factor RskA